MERPISRNKFRTLANKRDRELSLILSCNFKIYDTNKFRWYYFRNKTVKRHAEFHDVIVYVCIFTDIYTAVWGPRLDNSRDDIKFLISRKRLELKDFPAECVGHKSEDA